MYLSILKPNPDKPEFPKHKYQIPNKLVFGILAVCACVLVFA